MERTDLKAAFGQDLQCVIYFISIATVFQNPETKTNIFVCGQHIFVAHKQILAETNICLCSDKVC